MTIITCENDRGKYTINIEGHSMYNPGNDIVCSACSILTYTLLNSLADITTERLNITENEDGFNIVVKGIRESIETVKVIVDTIMSGYELLEEQYPANVNVTW